jgi:predicted hotdog family 3-hydroxylacyl-ACP dehydratase
MKLPLRVRDVQHVLPHRDPMIWVDEVLEAGVDGGVAAVDLGPDRLYVDADGHCLTFAAVEWVAETYGYARACHYMIVAGETRTLKRAFLVGVTQLDLPKPLPATGRVLIEARTSRELAPLVLVKGQVRGEDGTVYAEGQLKLYFEE